MGRKRKQSTVRFGKRAVISIRVSGAEQAKPGRYGPENQELVSREYCAQRGYTVVADPFLDIGISGAAPLPKRKGLSAAIEMCEAGDADVIVFYMQDRLGRGNGIFEQVRHRARRSGYRLEVASDGRVLTDEDDEMNGDVFDFVASMERKLIARRLRGGRRLRSSLDGRGSGPLPFGYTTDIDDNIVIDEPAAAIVRELLRLRDEGTTYQLTANTLNQAGYRTPKGGLWTVGHVQGIERRRHLYTTGERLWAGKLAKERWPIIYQP